MFTMEYCVSFFRDFDIDRLLLLEDSLSMQRQTRQNGLSGLRCLKTDLRRCSLKVVIGILRHVKRKGRSLKVFFKNNV